MKKTAAPQTPVNVISTITLRGPRISRRGAV
jgi:hypothetical protein